MIGIGLIFAGFIILGIFGAEFFDVSVQAQEFETCFEYFDDRPPVPIECEAKLQDKVIFSGLVAGLVGAGIFALVKGVRGKWDQDVKPEDMLGPGGPNKPDSSDSNKPK